MLTETKTAGKKTIVRYAICFIMALSLMATCVSSMLVRLKTYSNDVPAQVPETNIGLTHEVHDIL